MGNAQGAGVQGAGLEQRGRGLDVDAMLSEWECMPCKVRRPLGEQWAEGCCALAAPYPDRDLVAPRLIASVCASRRRRTGRRPWWRRDRKERRRGHADRTRDHIRDRAAAAR